MLFFLGVLLSAAAPSLVDAAIVINASIGHDYPNCSTGPLSSNGVCDTGLSPGERARSLVAALETDEKFDLLVNGSPGVTRLGLPSYQWWQEALHGIVGSPIPPGNPGASFETSGNFSYSSSFPQPILMGAAFDDDLIEAVATVISTEARAFNNFGYMSLDFWTPNINPYKDPRWGRGQETPGEDPLHLSSYVRSLIRGLQGGDDPETLKVIATCKHYTGYDIENWEGNERYGFDAKITQQDLAEYYMPTFQACVRANVGSFMCSYNAVNGRPACSSDYLLNDVLRGHWGWDREYQYVASDCDAVDNIFDPHMFRDTPEEAAAAALKAGTDSDCGDYYSKYLPGAYEQGLIDDDDLDRSLIRLYSALAKAGYFDPVDANPYRSFDFSDVFTPEAEELVRVAAEKGIVMIKNDDNTLPLLQSQSQSNDAAAAGHDNNSSLSVAMIGVWAKDEVPMQGNYYGSPKYIHSAFYAAQQFCPQLTVLDGGDPGNTTNFTGTPEYERSLSAARQADVILFFEGPDTNQEAEEHDRTTINFPKARVDIITSLAALGKPFVLVTMGDQQDTTPFLENSNVSSIIWAGYPGMSGGDAIMNVLTGKVAPAGRLPVTQYPARYVEEIPMTDMALRPGGGGGGSGNASSTTPGRTYMWYDEAVVPFGFGMHYTEFSVAVTAPGATTSFDTAELLRSCGTGLGLVEDKKKNARDLCPFQTITVRVQNDGDTVSDYVVLGFLTGEYGPKPYPIKRLVDYTRLSDVPTSGGSKEGSLELTLGSLARHNEEGDMVLYPGSYELVIDVPAKSSWKFEITGEEVVLSEWPKDTGV